MVHVTSTVALALLVSNAATSYALPLSGRANGMERVVARALTFGASDKILARSGKQVEKREPHIVYRRQNNAYNPAFQGAEAGAAAAFSSFIATVLPTAVPSGTNTVLPPSVTTPSSASGLPNNIAAGSSAPSSLASSSPVLNPAGATGLPSSLAPPSSSSLPTSLAPPSASGLPNALVPPATSVAVPEATPITPGSCIVIPPGFALVQFGDPSSGSVIPPSSTGLPSSTSTGLSSSTNNVAGQLPSVPPPSAWFPSSNNAAGSIQGSPSVTNTATVMATGLPSQSSSGSGSQGMSPHHHHHHHHKWATNAGTTTIALPNPSGIPSSGTGM